ncbi:hypothetical protein [Actinoallomurus iriomotensis]|uniref:Uncharacterized protein n=1 Tax=Actinoallomurus iriomotensis TaxID=478107 RepID=A0A9W6RKP7_9ACTN|nr:hypothetical protein [Actinoallomurus iriomotensis]GLY77279.1 hypothetical protein Airi01_055460 [Actinoallomurus iriomotensis]
MAAPITPDTPGWTLSKGLVDKTGHPISAALQEQISRRVDALDGPAADAYLRGLGLHLKVVYQPASRFWTFQIIEASLFIGLAAALIGIAIGLLHRRNA